MDTVRENNLDLITSALGTQGYVRIVGSADGKSYRMAIQDFMDLVAENPAVAELVTEEAEARQAADNEITLTVTNLQGALASEISARQAADTTLQGAISSEATARAAADTAIAQDVTELKADFEDFEANGTSTNTEALLSDDYVTESVPYIYRQTGGGIDGAGSREIDEIVGGSVVWNQLIKILTNSMTKTDKGVTWTDNRDGTYSVVSTSGATENIGLTLPALVVQKDHKYLLRSTPAGGSASTFCSYVTPNVNYIRDFGNGTIVNATATANTYPVIGYVFAGATIPTAITFKPQLFDLTAMFGSTIADYLYSLEQTTAGAGVALFRKLFPDDYYAYNAGELMSVSGVSAHVMRDSDDNIIGNYPLDSSLTLRGIPKLDANNNIYYDGDIYAADGTVTRRYGVYVFDGTEGFERVTWTSGGTEYHYFRLYSTAFTNKIQNARTNGMQFITTAKYMNYYGLTYWYSGATIDDRVAWTVNGVAGLCIRDDAYTDAASFKTAMSGVMLVYELATPTTETADPYTSPQICDKYGTEEYVTTGIVPVGHSTKYLADLKAKIEGLPWNFASLIAPTETTYKATQNYTTGALFIVENVLYKATANIANGGTITPGTNCTATTLAEVISALS